MNVGFTAKLLLLAFAISGLSACVVRPRPVARTYNTINRQNRRNDRQDNRNDRQDNRNDRQNNRNNNWN